MNTRSILFLLFLALLSQSAVAQGFLRTYAPELSEAADLVQTADGGYVMAGIIHGDSLQGGVGPNRIFLQRVDADGNILWTNHLDVINEGANSVCQTVDGGFALVSNLVQSGNNDFSRVFKVDAAGQVVWTRDLATFNNFNTNGFSDVISTSDGGIVIAGNARTDFGIKDGINPITIIQTNETMQLRFCQFLLLFTFLFFSNTILAQGFIQTYAEKSVGKKVVETPDGGFVLAGEIYVNDPNGGGDISSTIIIRTDSEGVLRWSDTFNISWGGAQAVCLTSENNIIWVSRHFISGDTAFATVMCIGEEGIVRWEKYVPMPDFNYSHQFVDVEGTNDGGILLFGTNSQDGDEQDFRLVKLDSNGQLLWDKYVGTPGVQDRAVQMTVLSSGDVLLGGDNDVFDNYPIKDRVTMAKTDASGNLLWQRWYDKPDTLWCHGLAVGSEDEYALLTTRQEARGFQILTTNAEGMETSYHKFKPHVSTARSYGISDICSDGNNKYTVVGSGYLHNWNEYEHEMFIQQVNAFGQTAFLKTYQAYMVPGAIIATSDGGYAVTGTFHLNGYNQFKSYLLKTNAIGEAYMNTLQGMVYFDHNGNCTRESDETAMRAFTIRIQKTGGETIYATSRPDGTWSHPIGLGTYTIDVLPRFGVTDLWETCQTAVLVVDSMSQPISLPATGVRSQVDCPYMEVDLAASIFRPCRDVPIHLTACNYGNQLAEEATIELTVDNQFTYVSSSLPVSGQTNNTYTFDLGDVLPVDCVNMVAIFKLSCSAEIDDVLCIEAHVFPDSTCTTPDPHFDGSHLGVSGACAGPEVVFTVENSGLSMSRETSFVILENNTVYTKGTVNLGAGQDTVFTIPSLTGSTYYLRVDQTPGHPTYVQSGAGIDTCNGSPVQPELLLQLGQDENEPFLASHCDIVRASYDPNDKRGFPLGLQNANYIVRGQELDYMVRFQNTGNDTAFLVVIRDTIDTKTLDITSLRPGVSSHPYSWELTGTGALKFRFENILLPDSATNPEASQGFVQFRIQQQPKLAAGTQIQNRAGIYFDFNAPIITNTSLHTIAYDLSSIFATSTAVGDTEHRVFPNPCTDQAQFVVENVPIDTETTLQLFNTAGQLVRHETNPQPAFTFFRKGLPAGIYFYKVDDQQGKMLAEGRIVVGGN